MLPVANVRAGQAMDHKDVEPSGWLPPGASRPVTNHHDDDVRLLRSAPIEPAQVRTTISPDPGPSHQISCPKCGCTQIIGAKRGFGLGHAVAGGILAGGVGLLAGFLGGSKVVNGCQRCGHSWRAGR